MVGMMGWRSVSGELGGHLQLAVLHRQVPVFSTPGSTCNGDAAPRHSHWQGRRLEPWQRRARPDLQPAGHAPRSIGRWRTLALTCGTGQRENAAAAAAQPCTSPTGNRVQRSAKTAGATPPRRGCPDGNRKASRAGGFGRGCASPLQSLRQTRIARRPPGFCRSDRSPGELSPSRVPVAHCITAAVSSGSSSTAGRRLPLPLGRVVEHRRAGARSAAPPRLGEGRGATGSASEPAISSRRHAGPTRRRRSGDVDRVPSLGPGRYRRGTGGCRRNRTAASCTSLAGVRVATSGPGTVGARVLEPARPLGRTGRRAGCLAVIVTSVGPRFVNAARAKFINAGSAGVKTNPIKPHRVDGPIPGLLPGLLPGGPKTQRKPDGPCGRCISGTGCYCTRFRPACPPPPPVVTAEQFVGSGMRLSRVGSSI
jgi:hypothetical protein